MSVYYDPHTGRRVWTAEDKLADLRAYLVSQERELREAERDLGRTLWNRIRITIWFVLASSIALIWGITGIVAAGVDANGRPDGNWVALIFVAVAVGLISYGMFFEAIGAHRGGAKKFFDYRTKEVAETNTRVARAVENVRIEEADAEAESQRKRDEPTKAQLLKMVVGSTSRSLDEIVADAALWAKVTADPDNDELWAKLSAVNGWDADLTAKVRAHTASIRPTPTAELEPSTAGWAG